MLCSGEYATMIRSKDHSFHLRKALVRHAAEYGIRAASRHFAVSRTVVRTWARRYEDEGLDGLHSHSTRPKTSPYKVSDEVEQLVLSARERSGFGAQRLIEEFDLPCGISAARRILRQNKLTKKPRKKHQRKNDLRETKKRYNPFQRLQMDLKHLCDQPRYLPQAKALGLPLFQYTIRDVRTGAKWLSFATECASVYAELTIRRLLKHLKSCGIDVESTIVQTDNGSEFKGTQIHFQNNDFAAIVRQEGANHRFIPPACPNANADVESSHSRIEPEFYDREDFKNRSHFFDKITAYQRYWNLGRPNRSKAKQTPWEILHNLLPYAPIESLLLPPVLLDILLENEHHPPRGVGHKVPPSPEK